MLPLTSKELFSGERFSDGVAVRLTDVTTCYPGQPFQGTTAHDGVVRNRHRVGKRARTRHSNQPLGFNLGSSPTRVVPGCADLRRLWLGPINHPPHHNAGRVDVQGQLDLLVLRLGLGGSFACNLRSAGLSVRTGFVITHNAGGRTNFVARPPAFMPSINREPSPTHWPTNRIFTSTLATSS